MSKITVDFTKFQGGIFYILSQELNQTSKGVASRITIRNGLLCLSFSWVGGAPSTRQEGDDWRLEIEPTTSAGWQYAIDLQSCSVSLSKEGDLLLECRDLGEKIILQKPRTRVPTLTDVLGTNFRLQPYQE